MLAVDGLVKQGVNRVGVEAKHPLRVCQELVSQVLCLE